VLEPLSVLFRLDKELVDVIENRPDQAFQEAVSLIGAFRYPAVDQDDGATVPVGLTKKIRPVFRFDKDKKPGAQGAKKPFDDPAEIQRDKKYLIDYRERLSGHTVSGVGQCGQIDRPRRMLGLQLSNETAQTQDFANRDRVDPERGRFGLSCWKPHPEPFPKRKALSFPDFCPQ